MTDTQDPTYRSKIDPPADSVALRDAEEVEGGDDMMEVRMPVASTGEVRNEGDDPLTTDELRGMAEQVGDLTRGVFPEHGKGNFVSAGQYSQFEKLGYWVNGEVVEGRADDGEDLLMATARMPDPDTLPSATGDFRTALAILKEQAKRGIPISASIGWREDDDAPGGNDLMEASIVGIGADPRTSTEGGTETLARAAVEAGADPDALLTEVARAIRSPSLGHTYGPITESLSHEGVSLEEGELYCHDTGEVNDVGGPRREIECPACGDVLSGMELMADLNTDSGNSGAPDNTQDTPDVDGERPLGPPGDRDRFETFDECVSTLSEDDDMSKSDAERVCGAWEQASKGDRDRATDTVNGEEIDITVPEASLTAAEEARDAKDEFDQLSDCGTGDGMETARKALNGDLSAEYIADEVAAYLTSHADDVEGITDPPSDWSRETWTDGCGPVQYALWLGTATGTGLEWAQGVANDVARARDEEMPYPNRDIDNPAYSEGDAVTWDWQGETVHGRVADVGEQFTVGGNTITGEEGEAVYLIHEWDEEVEAFREENVAKPESSLSDSQMDMPSATEENFQEMTDNDTGTDAGTTDEQNSETTRAPADIGEDDVAEFVAETYDGISSGDVMAAMESAGAEFSGLTEDTAAWFIGDVMDLTAAEVGEMLEDAAKDDEEDQAGGGMDDDEEEEDEEMSEQSTDTDDLAERVAELEDALESVRSGEVDVDTPDTEQEQDADDGEESTTERATAGPNWRSV